MTGKMSPGPGQRSRGLRTFDFSKGELIRTKHFSVYLSIKYVFYSTIIHFIRVADQITLGNDEWWQ